MSSFNDSNPFGKTPSINKHQSKRKFGSSRSMAFKSSKQLGRLGNRASMAFSKISQRFLFGNLQEEHERQARIEYSTYFHGLPPKKDIFFDEIGYVRVIKETEDRALPRRLKFKGRIVLGCGRIYLDIDYLSKSKDKESKIPSKVVWSFDLGLIKQIKLKKETSKEVYITFLNNSIALNILLKDNSKIQLLLQRLFFEAKVQAQCFYKIMLETINETWFKVLKIGYLDGIQPKIEVSTQEKRLLVMDEDSLDLIEVCLRTEVDFWRLSKGKVDEDLNESMERLALFLKYTVRIDESNHWFEQVKEGKSKYIDKMKGDMLSSMNTGHQFDNSPLENLRNPPGLSLQNILITNKNLMITIKYSERIEQIKQVLQLQKQGTFEPVESDPFEQFVPATLIDDQTVAYLPQQTRQIEQEENIKDII